MVHFVDHISTTSSQQLVTPTSLTEAPPTLGETTVKQDKSRLSPGKDTQKIESAIPYLIPKDMTLEQLHAKVCHSPGMCTVVDHSSLLMSQGEAAVSWICTKFYPEVLQSSRSSQNISCC